MGLFSEFRTDLACPFCGAKVSAGRWPARGDLEPFYVQQEPGAFQVELPCGECGRTGYVVWDDDPGPCETFEDGPDAAPVGPVPPEPAEAMALLKARQADQALAWADQAAAARPTDPWAWAVRGFALGLKGDTSGARQALTEALAREPRLPNVSYNLGVLCQKAGDPAAAEAAFNAELNRDRGHARAREALARLQAQPPAPPAPKAPDPLARTFEWPAGGTGHVEADEWVRLPDRELPEERTIDSVAGAKAIVEASHRDLDEAYRLAEALADELPDLDLAHFWLAHLLERQDRLDSAAVAALAGLALARRKCLLAHQLGVLEARRGHLGAAARAWVRAVGYQLQSGRPTDHSPFLYLGTLAGVLGLPLAAVKLLGWADRLRDGDIRLDGPTTERLQGLVLTRPTEAVRAALHTLVATLGAAPGRPGPTPGSVTQPQLVRAPCDLCQTPIDEPEGYLLATVQIVGEPKYWRAMYDRSKDSLVFNGIFSYELFAQNLAGPAAPILADKTPWLICERCIYKFGRVRHAEAADLARHWWATGGGYDAKRFGPAQVKHIRTG